MVTRALTGAIAGAIAGVGLHLTWVRWLPTQCVGTDGPECGVAWAAMLPLFLCAWMFTGSTVLFWTLKLLKRQGTWPAAGLGCTLWVPVWFVFVLVGHSTTIPLEAALIGAPVVAYALAGVFTGRRPRSSAHGDQAVVTP